MKTHLSFGLACTHKQSSNVCSFVVNRYPEHFSLSCTSLPDPWPPDIFQYVTSSIFNYNKTRRIHVIPIRLFKTGYPLEVIKSAYAKSNAAFTNR